MKTVKWLALLIVPALAFAAGYTVRRPAAAPAPDSGRRILYYVDPMHPAYKSDRPGTAPDCGMTLEPVYADDELGSADPSAPKRVLYYRDPRDRDYTNARAGLNPETGDTLEPVYAPADTTGTIRISPDRQQLAGVRFATATVEGGARTVRTVGRIAYDETRVSHVHSRVDGWIDQVFVDFTGDVVKKGQPMLTLYSPDMLASQQELLLAARARDVMKGNPLPSAAEGGQSLFEAARRRLELWNLSEAQIQQVLATGRPVKNVPLASPATGFITARNAFPNQRVTADTDLYTIVDLSRVWVMADVSESDIPAIAIGNRAHVTLPYAPGARPIAAKVSYIQPDVDPTTRTLKVRLEVANPGLRLKPEMYVNVEFQVPVPERLVVPAGAIVDTGNQQTVFIDLGDGYLEPRQVQVGERNGDTATIVSGLAAGDRVVASGTFLIDSESQLKAAARSMGMSPGKMPEHPHD